MFDDSAWKNYMIHDYEKYFANHNWLKNITILQVESFFLEYFEVMGHTNPLNAYQKVLVVKAMMPKLAKGITFEAQEDGVRFYYSWKIPVTYNITATFTYKFPKFINSEY